VFQIGYSTSLTQGITLLLVIHWRAETAGETVVPTRYLSGHTGIPNPTAVKTLKSLSAAGILLTREGAGGGSQLARPISQITLLDVFLAVEQDTPLFKMHGGIRCDSPEVCALQSRMERCIDEASDAMKQALKNITLKDIWVGEADLPAEPAEKTKPERI
jgi:Rrf2 family protein